MFPLNLPPACVGLLTDALLRHEFTSHRRQHVIVVVRRLQAVVGEFPSMASDTSSFFPINRRQFS